MGGKTWLPSLEEAKSKDDEIERLEKICEQTNEEKLSLLYEAGEKDKEIEDLTTRLDILTNSLTEKTNLVYSLNRENESLKATVKELREMVNKYGMSDTIPANSEVRIMLGETTTEAMKRTCELLDDQLKNAYARLKMLNLTNRDLRREKQGLKNQLNDKERDILTLEKRITKMMIKGKTRICGRYIKRPSNRN